MPLRQQLPLTSIGRRDFCAVLHQQLHGLYIVTLDGFVQWRALPCADSTACVRVDGKARPVSSEDRLSSVESEGRQRTKVTPICIGSRLQQHLACRKVAVCDRVMQRSPAL